MAVTGQKHALEESTNDHRRNLTELFRSSPSLGTIGTKSPRIRFEDHRFKEEQVRSQAAIGLLRARIVKALFVSQRHH